MGRSRRGSGSVFRRTYRDPKGNIRKTKNWYIEFVAGNRTIRAPTEFTNRTDAAEFLKKRISDALGVKIILSRNVTYDDLRDLIITDYANNGRKSLGDLKTMRLPRLDAVFGGAKASDITTTSVERYKTLRLKDGAAPATVNRELASLKRIFRLGLRQGMVATMPYIAMLAAHNLRKGFFELDQFRDPQVSAERVSRAVRDRLTETADGTIRPLQPRELCRKQEYATAVYRSELAARLTAIGYEIERGRSGQLEIRGYTREYLDASSPRRQQIEDYLAEADRQGAAAAQIAAHQTREAKLDVSHEEMQHRHEQLAEQFGNQPTQVVEAAEHRRVHDVERERDQADAARRAVTFARDRNLEREAVVEERAILRDALQRSLGEARIHDIKQELERRAEGANSSVQPESGTPGRSFTTPAVMELEQGTNHTRGATLEQVRGILQEYVAIAAYWRRRWL